MKSEIESQELLRKSASSDRAYPGARYSVSEGYRGWIMFVLILISLCAIAAFMFR